jgi:hypothetical protein
LMRAWRPSLSDSTLKHSLSRGCIPGNDSYF